MPGKSPRTLAVLTACALALTLPALAEGAASMPVPPAGGAASPSPVHGFLPQRAAAAKARSAGAAHAASATTSARARGSAGTTQKIATKSARRSAPAHPSSGGKSSAKKAVSKPAARRVATSARVLPGWVTVGHYIRSLRGRGSDNAAMFALGAQDAARNPGGMQHMVLLDIGGQVHGGVHLSTTRRFISYRRLVHAMNAYVDGYHSRARSNAPVTIAIGTNNDLAVDRAQGRAWAREVVNPVRAHSHRYSQVTIAGADDIEPGFRAGPAETQEWLAGYLANTSAAFVFNGSADGCSPVHAVSHCNGGWSSRDLARFAGAMAPARTIVLPQIYNSTMASQWAQIARLAVQTGHPRLHIVGPLTENKACGGDPSCPTMPSWQAYRRLMSRLQGVHLPPSSLPYQVDLDVH